MAWPSALLFMVDISNPPPSSNTKFTIRSSSSSVEVVLPPEQAFVTTEILDTDFSSFFG